MKCIKQFKTVKGEAAPYERVIRTSDNKARDLVKTGLYRFASKVEWKQDGRRK